LLFIADFRYFEQNSGFDFGTMVVQAAAVGSSTKRYISLLDWSNDNITDSNVGVKP